MSGVSILWSPRGAAAQAARSPLWIPLLTLAVAGALASYPLLFRLRPAGLAQARLDATPEGMTAFSIFVFLGLRFAAPVLLPAAAWVTGQFARAYLHLALDLKVETAGAVRIAAYGFLPLAAERLMVGIVLPACGSGCDRFNPVASNLAFFFDPTRTSGFWYELARGADLFAFWALWATSWALAEFSEESPHAIWPGVAALWAAGLVLRAWLLG